MREKLSLLSKNPFSPPNLRLRGGLFSPVSWSSLLHHGGCPLCHGDPSLRHGGFSFRLCCCCEVNIKILFTMTTSSPPNSCPPPEPPPLSSIPIFTVTEAPPVTDLIPLRPDPKPPWLFNSSASLSIWFCYKDDAFMFVGALLFPLCFYSVLFVFYYVFLCLELVWFNAASRVFVEMPLQFWLFWNCLLYPDFIRTGTWVNINLIFPSHQQADVATVVVLDHRETTHSRTAPILAKEMIRNWIDSKTVDSPPSLVIHHMRKLFVWLIGLVVRFVVEPLWPRLYLCIKANALYCLIARSSFNLWLGNAPTLPDYPVCNVLIFIY